MMGLPAGSNKEAIGAIRIAKKQGYRQCQQDVVKLIERLRDEVENTHLIGFQESMLIVRKQVEKLGG